jgi:hypothetical protein
MLQGTAVSISEEPQAEKVNIGQVAVVSISDGVQSGMGNGSARTLPYLYAKGHKLKI